MQSTTDFNVGDIKPVECFKEGWEMIKNDYWLFFGITIVGLLIGGAVPLILVGSMLCGIYYCFLRKHDGQPLEFADLFKGFDYFAPSLIATLVIVAIILLPMLVVVIAGFVVAIGVGALTQNGGAFGVTLILVWCFVMLVVGLFAACIHVLIVFTHLLIVDRKLGGWDAVKLSAKASWQNVGGVATFIALQLVLSIVGMCALIVGAYLVLPVIYAGTTVMYRKIFPAMFIPPPVNVPPSPANYPSAGFSQ